jgi:transposase
LGEDKWKLAFATGLADRPWICTIVAGNLRALEQQVAKAKARFRLATEAAVFSCYEAGRDGFWLHRWLVENNIGNIIVDPASIETNRRQRRKKTDRLDAGNLVNMLVRHHLGEKKWSVVRVPSPEEEDRRHLHRDLLELTSAKTEQTNRIRGLLASVGARVGTIDVGFEAELDQVRTADGQPLAAGLKERLRRECARWQALQRELGQLRRQRNGIIHQGEDQDYVQKTRTLMRLKGIGAHSAWIFVLELFGWRRIQNRRQLGALVGLDPTPYDSGKSERERGISKAGNRRLRWLAVEIAWSWLRFQPTSALSEWWRRRFGAGSKRLRKIGIVALARKLLIALWHFLERGEVPAEATLVDWRAKLVHSSGGVAMV